MINLKLYVTEQNLGSYRPPNKGELIFDFRNVEGMFYSGARHQIWIVPPEITVAPHEEQGTWHYNFEATYNFRADTRTRHTNLIGKVPYFMKSSLQEIGFRGFVYQDGIEFPETLAEVILANENEELKKEKDAILSPFNKQIASLKEEMQRKEERIHELENKKPEVIQVWYPIKNQNQLDGVMKKVRGR